MFSVSSKPNFKDPTGSINASVGRIDSKWKSVTHQAGIYAGEDGYDIHVGNGTTLEGAVIKSEAPKAKNTLTTKSLEMKDIQNEAEYTYSNNGIGYNYYGSKKKLEEMKTKDKKGYDKIYNSIGLVPNLGVGSKGKASSTTQSAISDGILTVDGKEIEYGALVEKSRFSEKEWSAIYAEIVKQNQPEVFESKKADTDYIDAFGSLIALEERYEALLELLPQDEFSYAGTHPKWVADVVVENTLNKEDTINDISDFLEQCSTLRELQDKLMEYFDLQDC